MRNRKALEEEREMARTNSAKVGWQLNPCIVHNDPLWITSPPVGAERKRGQKRFDHVLHESAARFIQFHFED
jgi:hypothetical protein